MRLQRAAEHVLLALGLAAVAWTFRDYGVTWDEWFQSRYGELALAYFRSGGADTRCNSFEDLYYYGPAFEMLAALAYDAVGAFRAEIRHLLSALAALLTVVATMRYARLFGRPWLPVLAGAALLLWPRFYGHAFLNSKDIPFACGVSWALLATARWLLRGRRWSDALLVGLATGAALAIRPGGLLPLLSLILAALALDGFGPRPPGHSRAPAQLGLVVVVAWSVMVLPWPWAHGDPIGRPLLALEVATRFPASLPVLFEGTYYSPDALPRHYVPKYLLITTPPAHLLLLLLGAAVALGLVGAPRDAEGGPARLLLVRLALVWFAAPVAAAVVARPVLYDEVRHFLFLLPAASLLMALGAQHLIDRLRPRLGARAPLAALLLLLPLPALVRLHPYQYTYFNALAGGLATAARSYETDYWLSSYKEGMEWIERQPWRAARRRRLAIAANPVSRWCAEYYASPRLEIKTVAEAQQDPAWRYDVFLATTRFRMSEYASAPIAHTVGRDGAVFAVVRVR